MDIDLTQMTQLGDEFGHVDPAPPYTSGGYSRVIIATRMVMTLVGPGSCRTPFRVHRANTSANRPIALAGPCLPVRFVP